MTVELGGRRIEDTLPGRQGRLLFAYLAVHRLRPVGRAELIDVLWPIDSQPTTADATLTGVLSRLRHVLGADVLEGRSELRLALPSKAWIDVEIAAESIHRAESAVAIGDWPRAWTSGRVALHVARREFLTGCDAPWIEARRRVLQSIESSALECIGEAGLGLGGSEIAAAERSGRALIACEPYRESGYRLLMRAHQARGNDAAALTVYEELRGLLREALGTTPSAETQALFKQLLA